jgi:S1-C subfamily serine protease
MRLNRLVLSAPIALVAVASAAQLSQTKTMEASKQLVVMITCGQESGAGIIVGSKNDRIYLITAKHVIPPNHSVVVEFFGMPGDKFTAERIGTVPELDLGVLFIPDTASKHIDAAHLPFERLGASAQLVPGSKVGAIGYGSGNPWDSNPPGVFYDIADIVGEQVLFRSLYVSYGYSGGGLFDANWKLVGMITKDQPPTSTAISIDRIFASLAKLHCPVNFPQLSQITEPGSKIADQAALLIGEWKPFKTRESDNVRSAEGALKIVRADNGSIAAQGDFKIEVQRYQDREVDLASEYIGHFAPGSLLQPHVTQKKDFVVSIHQQPRPFKTSFDLKGSFQKYKKDRVHNGPIQSTREFQSLTARLEVMSDNSRRLELWISGDMVAFERDD